MKMRFEMWQFTGNGRPGFAIERLDGQESVWDYPRPPICVEDSREIMVRDGHSSIALGGFYGGWVTDEIVGPYKSEPDTVGW